MLLFYYVYFFIIIVVKNNNKKHTHTHPKYISSNGWFFDAFVGESVEFFLILRLVELG